MESAKQRECLATVPGNQCFDDKLASPLRAEGIQILQLNVGRRCNLNCRHCHVSAGPNRDEMMGREVFEKCLGILTDHPIGTIDLTGGAPEMNPHLPWFISEAARLERRLMVRTNLVILGDPDYRHFIDCYVDNRVELVTSLPHFQSRTADRQRGQGVFEKVIEVMRLLNERGYARPGSGLLMHVVHNPVGAFLPGAQRSLSQTYKERLSTQYGISFNELFCLNNAPVGRYLDYLFRTDNYEDYMQTLIEAFNVASVDGLMCRTTLSVGWDGRLYDCDFNQMLDLAVDHGAPDHVDIFDFDTLGSRRIVVANHCYACTAGAGSSCQGSLDKDGNSE